jgi:hypothetical protein
MIGPPQKLSLPESFCAEIRDAFQKYASSFRRKVDVQYNKHMELKQFHTARVCEEINGIAKSLGFNSGQRAFVEVIAWLHDIGRFEQFDKYGTFADAESENHAEIAIRVIENKGFIDELDNHAREVIYRTILNHNIPRLPDDEPKTIDFYSRLLRDADKLDIWRIALEMNIFHTIRTGSMPTEYNIPEKLINCFNETTIITLDKVQSFYDSVLFRLSWIYDLNFRYTIKQVKKRKIADKLLAKLPPSEVLNSIANQVNLYMIAKISV